ncbi:hypothetical protein DVH24_001363 [Malus domestica]|uniref:Cytochrome P450 n=1 Tax=Malus domestica TaxID=3750 RepID=A0A498JZ10_MALDO|nr:hypothetical protein DVH24_001363 [Malus domestica]
MASDSHSSYLYSTWSQSDQTLLTFISATFLLFLYLWLVKKSNNPIPPLPPGPRALPLVGNLLSLDPELHSYFAGLAQSHGPIFKLRLGNTVGVVVTSPSSAREILKDHDATCANRDVPAAARAATYGGIDIAWTPYGPEWRMLRKVCVLKMLSNTTLDSVYALRRKQLRQTVGNFYDRIGSRVNVGEQMFLNVLNVITNMLWGGTVEGDERAGLGAEFREVVSEMTELLGKPNVSDFYPGLARFDMQGVVKQMSRLVRRFDGIFEKIIDQRLRLDKEGEKEESNKDFLTFLLKLKEEGGDSKAPFTMSHLKALLMVRTKLNGTKGNTCGKTLSLARPDMVVGGTNTSSNTTEFALQIGLHSGKDFNYFPFGLGIRICARIAMAERMVMHSLATLLHSFD